MGLDAFPLWALDDSFDEIDLSPSLRAELQAWSDRVSHVMWGENGPDAPNYREPPVSVIDGLRQEGLALTERVRQELPAGSEVWFFPDEGV